MEKKPIMPAVIVIVLLAYFGIALFGKAVGIDVDSASPLVQTLINLTIAASSYFLGTTQGSAKKDDVIAGKSPPVKVDDTTPIRVAETPPKDAP